jgi:pimeloyl-ACP methyl ester carboxylesterase
MTMLGTEPFTPIRSDFTSHGLRCRGDLILPAGIEHPPAVILAHGFGAERSWRLPAYAERFAERGLAAYLFDYRCFGESEGEPRNHVDPHRHLQDWRSAIAHVRSLPEVDGGRVALWGTSYSGGHVIVTAAGDPKLAAIVAQVPFVDSLTTITRLGAGHVLEAAAHGLRDLLRAALGQSPHYVKIVGRPDQFAEINTPEAWPGYSALVPEGSSWQNRCPARAGVTLAFYRPIAVAGRVRCPALIMLGEQDSLISPTAVERTAARMPRSTLIRYPFGHFDIYTGEAFETAVAVQAQFLVDTLEV